MILCLAVPMAMIHWSPGAAWLNTSLLMGVPCAKIPTSTPLLWFVRQKAQDQVVDSLRFFQVQPVSCACDDL